MKFYYRRCTVYLHALYVYLCLTHTKSKVFPQPILCPLGRMLLLLRMLDTEKNAANVWWPSQCPYCQTPSSPHQYPAPPPTLSLCFLLSKRTLLIYSWWYGVAESINPGAALPWDFLLREIILFPYCFGLWSQLPVNGSQKDPRWFGGKKRVMNNKIIWTNILIEGQGVHITEDP